MEPSSTTVVLTVLSLSLIFILFALYRKYSNSRLLIDNLSEQLEAEVTQISDLRKCIVDFTSKHQEVESLRELAINTKTTAEKEISLFKEEGERNFNKLHEETVTLQYNLHALGAKYSKAKSVAENLEEILESNAAENASLRKTIDELNEKYQSIQDAEKYAEHLKSRAEEDVLLLVQNGNNDYNIVQEKTTTLQSNLQELNDKYIASLELYRRLEETISLYRDDLEVMEFGVYRPVFEFQTSEEYKSKLEYNYLKQRELVKSDSATHCSTSWSVDGSVAKGARMTRLQIKLMLFAFNGECDSFIAKMKWNSATRTIEKINKAYEAINKLGSANSIEITYEYLQLKLEQLALSHELLNKIQDEKEEQRLIREQMREEERAKREFELAEREAQEEEKRYQKALNRVREDLKYASQDEVDSLISQIGTLEVQLRDATSRKERAISMAQQTKIGHIYIISNIGSFGEGVYKIGMTRRLEPMDRVKELGDASVPFQFDVHAIIFSDNAPQMEYDLHKRFQDKRMNRINGRKEFFKVTIEEIETYVNGHTGASIEVTKLAEAKEFRETMAMLNSHLENRVNQIINSDPLFPETLIDLS